MPGFCAAAVYPPRQNQVGVVRQVESAALKAASDNRSAPFARQLTGLFSAATLDAGEKADKLGELGGRQFFLLPFVCCDGGDGGGVCSGAGCRGEGRQAGYGGKKRCSVAFLCCVVVGLAVEAVVLDAAQMAGKLDEGLAAMLPLLLL